MINRYRSAIVNIACRIIAPFIFLFGLYVIAFGHYSPGGGFQGGTILASGVILLRLSLGRRATANVFPPKMGLILGAVGLIIYAFTGLTSLLAGGGYLDYSYLPLAVEDSATKRYLGILFVDVGIALAVFGVLFSIFDTITEE